MATFKASLVKKSWRRGSFMISTDPDLISDEDIKNVLDYKDVYWAKSFPAADMREMLNNSLVFGIHHFSEDAAVAEKTASLEESAGEPSVSVALRRSALAGFGRCITDFTTFLYLTDVWVDDSYRGQGLGQWLIGCVKETSDSMPYLRRSMLFTSDWERSVPFYRKHLGMELLEPINQPGKSLALMQWKGPGMPDSMKAAFTEESVPEAAS